MLTAPILQNLPGIRHAFFTREGGVSQGLYASLNGGIGSNDEAAHVAENRARMAAALKVAPDRFATVYQVHSPDVVVAEDAWSPASRPRADAIVTRKSALAIGVTTADCGPVLFADPTARVIGAAHAGWRGARAGVLEATLAAMEKLGANRERIIAAIGPMIRQRNYEVGVEFLDDFCADDPANARFFTEAAPGILFDLAGYIAARLRRAGLTQIEDIGLCTYGDPARFYSYRRATHLKEADYGRHISAIALVD
jgi:YfiH family protein